MSLTVSEDHVSGILAIPRVSRNLNLYLPEELQKADGLKVPFFLDHEDLEMESDQYGRRKPTGRLLPIKPRGEVMLHYDKDLMQLHFEGEVWDKKALESIRSGERPKVSLAADPSYGEKYHGIKVPLGLKFFSMSGVKQPGIPESTMELNGQLISAEDYTVHPFPLLECVSERFAVIEGVFENDMCPHEKVKSECPECMEAMKVAEPINQTMMKSMKSQYGKDQGKDVYYATQTKLGKESSEVKKQSTPPAESLMSSTVKEAGAMTDNLEGAQDATVKQGAARTNAGLKSIGLADTPYEDVTIPKDEPPGRSVQGAKKPIPDSEADAGSAANPNSYKNLGNKGGGKMDDLDEETYGFSKEDWSTLSKPEKALVARLEQMRKAGNPALSLEQKVASKLKESGVLKETPISDRRESRLTGKDISQFNMPANMEHDDFGFSKQMEVKGAVAELASLISSQYRQRPVGGFKYLQEDTQGHLYFSVPPLQVPRTKNKQEQIDRPIRLQAAMEEYCDYQNNYYVSEASRMVSEAISVGSTGATTGVDELGPALVIPTQTAGLTRDTVIFRPLPQGTAVSKLQTIQATTMGALTENIQPTVTDNTLAGVTVTTYERGALHQIGFRAERQIIGPFMEGQILADRIGELYDEDAMVFGTPNYIIAGAATATGVSGGIENATIPSGNKFEGDGAAYTNDVSITTGETMTAAAITNAAKQMVTQGYAPSNMVLYMHPKPYADLLQDTNIVRYIQNSVASGDYSDALIAAGVIPEYAGFEIRRSTVVPTFLTAGASSQTVYHAWGYKKGLSLIMSASRDVMIETYRDILRRSTWVSTHYDMGVQVLHPNSCMLIASS